MGTRMCGKIVALLPFLIFLIAGCGPHKSQVQEQQLAIEQPQVQQESGEMKYAVGITNIREGRNKESRAVGKLNPGQRVKAAFLQDDWYAVFNPDETGLTEANALGYVLASRLKNVEKESGEIKSVVAATNIRQARSKTSKVVGKLKPGQKVKAAFFQDNWYAVFDPDATDLTEENALGYVFAPRLKKAHAQDQ